MTVPPPPRPGPWSRLSADFCSCTEIKAWLPSFCFLYRHPNQRQQPQEHVSVYSLPFAQPALDRFKYKQLDSPHLTVVHVPKSLHCKGKAALNLKIGMISSTLSWEEGAGGGGVGGHFLIQVLVVDILALSWVYRTITKPIDDATLICFRSQG